MIAQTWPPLEYWLQADERMVATAVGLLEEQAAAVEQATDQTTDPGTEGG